MKRTIALLLTAVFVICVFAACGKGGEDAAAPEETLTQQSVTAASAEPADILTAYREYFEAEYRAKYVIIGSDTAGAGATGIYCAELADLDGDGIDELVIACSEKGTDEIVYKIDCLSCSDGQVRKLSSFTAFTAADNSSELYGGYNWPLEHIIYTFDYNGKTYVAVEYLTWVDTYDYGCRVYALEDGSFTEAANIIVPAIGTVGNRLAYSTALAPSMTVDNSDFDTAAFEGGEYVKSAYCSEDSYILFYIDGYENPAVYDKYYSNVDDAVVDFFAHFGIERGGFLKTNETAPDFALVRYEGCNIITDFGYWFSYDNDEPHVVFTDNSDLKQFIAD